MKRIVLVRHGESAWNLENRFTGWTDVDLTPKGERYLESHAGQRRYDLAEKLFSRGYSRIPHPEGGKEKQI